MKCSHCGAKDTKVLESRESQQGLVIRRRRECSLCGARFTTFERQEERPLYVIKKTGRKELFSSQKLLRSIALACQKLSLSPEELELLVDKVETRLKALDDGQSTSSKIGELVLEGLLELDPVAYVRFASVYRAFSTPADFAQEIQRLTQVINKAQSKI